jgi:hypothetical protein
MTPPARRPRRNPIAPSIVAYDTTAYANPKDALRTAARAQGCTCNPDVTLTDDGQAHLWHDDWCALLRQQDVN